MAAAAGGATELVGAKWSSGAPGPLRAALKKAQEDYEELYGVTGLKVL